MRDIKKFAVIFLTLLISACNTDLQNAVPDTSRLAPVGTYNNSHSKNSEAYTGKWNGKEETSLTILSRDPLHVKYCLQSNCSEHFPEGTVKNFAVLFPPSFGFKGEIIDLKKNGNTYNGTYILVGSQKEKKARFTRIRSGQ